MGARTESSLEEKGDDDEEEEEEEERRRRSSVPTSGSSSPSGRIKDDVPNTKHKVVLEEEEDVEKEADKGKEERKEEDGKEENDEGKREREGFSLPLLKKFTDEPVKLRVHDVKIEGNVRTKDAVIEAEFEKVKNAENSLELLREVALAMSRIEGLGIFEECLISLEPGPIELPGTTNVFVNVKEPKNSYSGDVGIYTKPEAKSWTFDGSIKWKNLLGYAETWDSTVSYGYDGTTEMSTGLFYPRFKGFPVALLTRASVFSQDWLKYSSYTEQIVGISAGIVSDTRHDLSYNITWRTLQDPSHMASPSIRKQLGHSLLSSIKYTFKIDERDSVFRPMRGYAIRSSTQVAGIGPDSKLLRFVRQELDLRGAIPLGFANAALNLGISGGFIIPWGEGFRRKATPISDRFFIGGNASLACDMNGPVKMPGFHCRGVGPMDVRRAINLVVPDGSEEKMRDALGGDISVTSFADLSFDLPLQYLRDRNIHGHCFVCAGNLIGLPEIDESMSVKKFWSSTRVSAGAGLVIPTRLFRLEVNFCKILRQSKTDCSQSGMQLSFASPH